MNFKKFVLDEKVCNTWKFTSKSLIYEISYKTLIGPKPLLIRFDKINGYIRIYGGIRHLKLIGSEKYDAFYNRIRYITSLKSSIIYVFSHYYTKIKVHLMILYL